MAACATTFYEVSGGLDRRCSARNAELLSMQPLRRQGVSTPEIPFLKHLDNSRLVKAPDPVRMREMRLFTIAVAVMFVLTMIYALQHFSAIEGGYRVESEKQLCDQLREENRQLRLSEAQLSQPERIDKMARELGLAEPEPGQVIHPDAAADPSAPALAQALPPAPGNSTSF